MSDEMSDDKITQDEMVRMFGTHMPIEAVNLAFDSPGDMTIRELRAKLREIAAVRAERVLVEVTPADRFAAAEAGQSFARWTPGQVAKTMRGDGDECGMVQAFARHRLDALTTMQDREGRLNEMMAEIQMNAHKWMEAHDKLKAGKPYDLPKPADLPEAIAAMQDREATLIRALTPFAEAWGRPERKPEHVIGRELTFADYENARRTLEALGTSGLVERSADDSGRPSAPNSPA